MVLCLFGGSRERMLSCADAIRMELLAGVHCGDEYQVLSADPQQAEALFRGLLDRHARGEAHIFYLAERPEQLRLLPEGALRICFAPEGACDLRIPPEASAEQAGEAMLALLESRPRVAGACPL